MAKDLARARDIVLLPTIVQQLLATPKQAKTANMTSASRPFLPIRFLNLHF